MTDARQPGGLSCVEVLAALVDVVEGDAPADLADAVREHVRVCTNCERFGAAYAGMVARLTRPPDAIPHDVGARLAGIDPTTR